jgi:hypothetical protein
MLEVGEMITDPAAVQIEIDRLCRALDAAGRELGTRIGELSDAELRYGDLFEDALVQLVEDLDGSRLPGEDVRRALIHRSPEIREAWHTLRRLARRIEALEKWSRKCEAELVGRESQLRSLAHEARQ